MAAAGWWRERVTSNVPDLPIRATALEGWLVRAMQGFDRNGPEAWAWCWLTGIRMGLEFEARDNRIAEDLRDTLGDEPRRARALATDLTAGRCRAGGRSRAGGPRRPSCRDPARPGVGPGDRPGDALAAGTGRRPVAAAHRRHRGRRRAGSADGAARTRRAGCRSRTRIDPDGPAVTGRQLRRMTRGRGRPVGGRPREQTPSSKDVTRLARRSWRGCRRASGCAGSVTGSMWSGPGESGPPDTLPSGGRMVVARSVQNSGTGDWRPPYAASIKGS